MITKRDWIRWLAILAGLTSIIVITTLFAASSIVSFIAQVLVIIITIIAACFIFSNEERKLAKRLEGNIESSSEARVRKDKDKADTIIDDIISAGLYQDSLSKMFAAQKPDYDISDLYSLVEWPDIQDYMEEDWYNSEVYSANAIDTEDSTGVWFVPVNRLL
jgi:hypothetical protein